MTDIAKHPASFRDPAGFVFQCNGKWYRQVNQSYAPTFEVLKSSGLLDSLIARKRIIPHTEIKENLSGSTDCYLTLLPQQIPFLSYPYEWPFELFKDAAILTLDIASEAIRKELILKDATPFNIQIISGRPILIDTLSFEKYDPSKPWIAYRQFVETFLCPLLLASHYGQEFIQMVVQCPNGIPVNFCASLLPFSSRLNSLSALHIHLQAKFSAAEAGTNKQAAFSIEKLTRILTHLRSGILNLKSGRQKSTWNDYYGSSVLAGSYLTEKENLLHSYLDLIKPGSCLDLGSNTGIFSRIVASKGTDVVSIDSDSTCMNDLYLTIKKEKIQNLLPLAIDITNPSPPIGWDNRERIAFLQRKNFDLILALALVHHLAISRNIPLAKIANTFAGLGKWLIIEFVPKSDEKTRILLAHREDIFSEYDEPGFEKSFSPYYSIVQKSKLADTERILYLMQRK